MRILRNMEFHYSQPKGFVGRNICYAVTFNGIYYGSIVGGSACRFLPGRDKFLTVKGITTRLDNIINNIFFHLEKVNNSYPCRNFAPKVISAFRNAIGQRWQEKYGDEVIAFETLVEMPRTGECYRRDGWELVGVTKGFTCKRSSGQGTDSWSGRRVWDTINLRPKNVFLRLVEGADVNMKIPHTNSPLAGKPAPRVHLNLSRFWNHGG